MFLHPKLKWFFFRFNYIQSWRKCTQLKKKMESTGRSSDSFIYYFIRSFYHQIQRIDEYNSSSAQRSSMLSDLYHLNFVIFFSLRTSLYWCSILHSIKRLLCGNEVGSNSNDWKKTSQAKEHKGMEQPEKKKYIFNWLFKL